MATSGSYDFSVACSEIITGAMRALGLVATGESPSTQELVNGREALNMLIKFWQAEGIGLWLNQEATLFLEHEETSYTLGSSGDHASATSVKTEVKTGQTSGASSLELDSVTGMTDGDAIGIELDDKSLQWTTINGAPAGTTVTLTAALTDDVAVDNHVYTYTNLIERPLEIIKARRKNADDTETALTFMSRNSYMTLSDKTSTGPVTQVYYDPQTTNGVLYCYPACDDVQNRIVFTMRRPIADFDADADDADFPQEWLRPLKFNLAIDIASEFGVEPTAILIALAASSKEQVMGFDTEQASVYLKAKVR